MADRTVLVVSQRPLDLGGGGSARWQHMRRALPKHGWRVVECSPPAGTTTNDFSTDPRAARLAARRAQVMAVAGRVLEPLAHSIGVEPEALAPNNAWALTGRGLIRKAIERERPEVVVATAPPPGALLAAAKTVDGVPLILEMRDLWAGNPYFDRGGRLLPWLQRRAFRPAAGVVAVTDGCRQRLLAVDPEIAPRLYVLPNGFDPELLDRRTPPPGDSPATLIHAGALYGDRTVVALLQALGRPRLNDRVRLELVGTIDPETQRAVAATRDVEVVVDPPVSWQAAIDRVLGADIAVVINSPGTGGDVALPGKLHEALALGRPVLALTTQASETARLLERLGQTAGIAEPGDPDAIAVAVERLLDNPPPPVPPQALAEFDRDRIAARYAALLDELATRSSNSRSSGTTFSRR